MGDYVTNAIEDALRSQFGSGNLDSGTFTVDPQEEDEEGGAPAATQISSADMLEQYSAMLEALMDSVPEASGRALDLMMEVAPQLDEATWKQQQLRYERLGVPDLPRDVMAASGDAMRSIKTIADQLIRGEIPTDVAEQIKTMRAEMGESQGLFGQAAKYATARDLGRTSLDMMQLGAQYQDAASSLAARFMQTGQALNPTVDQNALYGGYMQLMAGQAGTALQAATSIAGANAELAWAQKLSAMNWDLTQQQMTLQSQINAQQISAARSNSILGLIGTIGGAVIGGTLGGPGGAAAGATAGSSLPGLLSGRMPGRAGT